MGSRMEIVWGPRDVDGKQTTTNIEGYVAGIQWSGANTEASRTLTFDLLNSPYDPGAAGDIPKLQMGDVIQMWIDGGRHFWGHIVDLEQKGEIGTVSVTCKDLMYNLLQSKLSIKFDGWTPEAIAKNICRRLGLEVGYLVPTGVALDKEYATDTAAYNIIMNAYSRASAETGKQYYPIMNGPAFGVCIKGWVEGERRDASGNVIETFVLKENEAITASEVKHSASGMVNRTVIYDKYGTQVGYSETKADVEKYGPYQESVTVSDDSTDGSTEGQNKLVGTTKEMTVSIVGDELLVSGGGVNIIESITGLSGLFYIKSDSHKWENGIHTTDLTLTLENITEAPEIQYSEPSSDDADGADGDIGGDAGGSGELNGRKVAAQFTAYGPPWGGINGGGIFADGGNPDKALAQGKLCCAAPPEIKFGTQVQVVGTGTDQDGKVYTVHDRGGAIKIKGGVYHIDLLMGTRKLQNDFGRRNGYLIIGDGTGFKSSGGSDDSSSSYSGNVSDARQKVCQLARSLCGKVRYVYGADNIPGGKGDCSSFTQYVYKHAVGIAISRTTATQVTKGHATNNPQPGDLIFWNTHGVHGHVGIYLGNGMCVQNGCSTGVALTNCNSSYWRSKLYGYRSIL